MRARPNIVVSNPCPGWSLRFSATLFGALLLGGFLSQASQAVEVKATLSGLAIDAGIAGTHVIAYPRLLTPNDQNLSPENIQVKPDGSGVTMRYQPSGILTLDKQKDGSWVFHFTEIPPDRVKFTFGIRFPLTIAEAGAMWSFDGQTPQGFPKTKGKLALFQGNPGQFVFQKDGAGFTINYPQKTWTQLTDQRVWGKDFFGLGQIFYFPGKKTVPEIIYSFTVGDRSIPLPSPAPVGTK